MSAAPPSGPLVLEWEQTLEDHAIANQRLVRRRLRRRLLLLLGLIGALAVGLWFVNPLATVIVVVVAVVVVALITRRALIRRGLKRLGEALPVGTAQWTIGPTGIAIELPSRSLRVPWDAVREVEPGREVHLVFVSTRRALFVPVRAVPDGVDFAELVAGWRADPAEHEPLRPPAHDPWDLRWDWVMADHEAYVHGILARQPVALRPLVVGLLLVLVGLAQLGLGSVFDDGDLSIFLLGGALYLFLGALFLIRGSGGRVLRHLAPLRVRLARWFDPESFPLYPIHMQFGPAGAYYRTRRGSGLMSWSTLTSVDDAAGCVNLMVGPAIGFSVPDRVFSDREERARFVDEMDRRVAQAPRKTAVDGTRGAVTDAENPFAPPEGP